jgi:hypothetical protein
VTRGRASICGPFHCWRRARSSACRVVSAWGGSLRYTTAARIWFVSNLGRYVPGKVWSIIAMGAMSQHAGVPSAAAIGSAMYIAVINVLAGLAVWALCGPSALPVPAPAIVLIGLAAAVFVLTPRAVPELVSWASKRVGREFTLAPLSYRTIIGTFAACAAAWIVYGIALYLLAAGTIGATGGDAPRYVALFTGSYLVGYLTLFAAGGVVVRESAMVTFGAVYTLLSAPQLVVLSVVSRIWLTILELVPGLLLLAFVPKRPTPLPHDVRSS